MSAPSSKWYPMNSVNSGGKSLNPIIVIGLVCTLFISSLGDEIALVALIFRVESVSSSGLLMAAFLAAKFAPMILLGPFTGQLIDRVETAHVLVATLVLQGILLIVLSNTDNITLLLAGAFILGGLFAVSGPALLTLAPVVAKKSGVNLENTIRINTVIEFIRVSGSLIGPLLGGLLIEHASIAAALLIDAATFLVPVPVILISGIRRHAGEVVKNRKAFEGAFEGIHILLKDQIFRVLLPVLTVAVFASSVSDVAFIFFVRGPLDSGSIAYGLLISAWGTGIICGGLAGGISFFKSRLELSAVIGAMLIGISFIISGAFPILSVVAVAFLLGGIANGLHNVAVRTLIHTQIPEHVHGRAFAAYVSLTNAAVVAGFTVGGPFAVHWSRVVYLISGALTAVIGASGLAILAARSYTSARKFSR